VAFGLLAFVGGRMIWESMRDGGEHRTADISRGLLLFTLSVATSIDALAVGLSFALLQTNVWISGGVIGVVSFGMTCLGFVIGCKAGPLLGKRAKLAGGIILIGIGLRILVTHLLGG
jgi:putative Mn2+ efflux pump MntP